MTNTSYSMQSFRRVAEFHPLWQHPFLDRCRSGKLTLQEVRVLAVQMYKFSQVFNRILASIIACCSDETAQLVILENLIDEMGQGTVANTHPELFRHFTRTLGIDDDMLLVTPPEPETQGMIDTYLALPHKYGYLAALGAVCFASEGIVNALYTQIRQGIVGASPLPSEALVFFEVHIDLDDNHAAHLEALIAPRLQTTEDAIYLHRAVKTAMDSRLQFFNGIQRAAAMTGIPIAEC